MKRKEQKPNVPPEEVRDELNPVFIFSLTHKDLLVKIVKDEIDIKQLARDQLANRGLSQGGKEISFRRAKEQAETLIWNESMGGFVSIPKD